MSNDGIDKYKRLAAFSSLITMEKEIVEIEHTFLASDNFDSPDLRQKFNECRTNISNLRHAIVKINSDIEN